MGTNYYLHIDCCPKCGRGSEKLHIGKSSAGWCFSLRVHPSYGINTLDDWEALFTDESSRIVDEYGEPISTEALLDRIKKRSWPLWSAENLERNHATAGPNGCARHQIDGRFCIGHGEGTWDYIDAEFS